MTSPALATTTTDPLSSPSSATQDSSAAAQTPLRWVTLCQREDLVPGSGVAAWLEADGQARQIALFTLPATADSDDLTLFAIDHHDPVSGANVIARGLLGDHAGEPLVISPLYKQRYRLKDGQCLDDETLSLQVWPVRLEGDAVQIQC
ncbi:MULTISPECIES: nitrite reductase small subunit NirD [unclassified Cobetia]|uniref:nitrite reductase small subunit NirD n=1 Tax=unclassified Cobetia TaxID=2609414 RepID=UPI00178CAD4C|nr:MULTISPECIES: nitrite reductase small subunit NirD [unclassified Cobetia]MBE2169615.1 nitrite reductase small subunit NirD [Cobetia sp. 2AS1]MDH2448423.1 nitrite reductase small subunit NirD [Cobetia sp. 2AS]